MGFMDNLSFNPKNIATPTMDPEAQKSFGQLKELLAGATSNSVKNLSALASTPIQSATDAQLVREFQENFLPQLTQGAAAQGGGGYSSIGASIAGAGSRLASTLAENQRDRMYNASQSLMDLYKSFSTINQNSYQRGDSPLSSLLSSLTKGVENASSEQGAGYADWGSIGASAGGALGSAIPVVGTGLGTAGGYLAGILGKYFKNRLTNKQAS